MNAARLSTSCLITKLDALKHADFIGNERQKAFTGFLFDANPCYIDVEQRGPITAMWPFSIGNIGFFIFIFLFLFLFFCLIWLVKKTDKASKTGLGSEWNGVAGKD